MKFGSVLAFVAGAIVGSVVVSIHSDSTQNKEESESKAKTEEKKTDNSDNGYREKTSIDDYTPISQEDLTAYDKAIDNYNGDSDPAEHESPEDDVEVTENEHRLHPPVEISKTEFGTYGFETQDFYYSPDRNIVWEDGCEPIEDDDRIRMFGDLLTEGYDSEDKQVIYIRNFRLMTDFAVYIN